MSIEERHHTDEELDQILRGMRATSDRFYSGAFVVGNHAFIEFCGLMNEYIEMCKTAKANGQDFTLANKHSNSSLKVEPYQIKYLAEKFDCIFGPMLADEQNRKIFFEEMGWQ